MLPLIEQGKLPNIARLMETGAWGNLHSTYPPITVPAWVSCVTGLNPGKLGIFHFMNNSHLNYEGVFANSTELKIKKIWDILGANDKKTILVGVPFTYPPSPIKGVTVAFSRIADAQIETYPPQLIHEIKKITAFDSVEQKYKEFKLLRSQKIQYLKEEIYLMKIAEILFEIIEKIKEANIYLMQQYSWDFLMTVFSSIDQLQHYFWAYQDPTHPLYNGQFFFNTFF